MELEPEGEFSQPGTQVVARVARLLRLIGESRGKGRSVSELATDAELTRPTAHRLLQSLAVEGLVERGPGRGRWLLGPELYAMGSIASKRYPIEDLGRPSLQRLATVTGESAFLSMRRGGETVCLVREEGSFPLRSFVLEPGVRFPLGVSSAGIVILAYLPLGEADELLGRPEPAQGHYAVRHTEALVRANVEAARRVGYSVNPGLILEGSFGMGAAVFDRSGRPAFALSLTGVEARFPTERRPELGRILMAEAHRVTTRLREVPEG